MPFFRSSLTRRRAAAALIAQLLCGAVHAGPHAGELRLVVGFPVGSAPDLLARTLARKLDELGGRRVVVDNRPGAGGQIAAQRVAAARPDGRTLLLAELGSIAIAPAVHGRLPYRPERDLAVLSEVARADFVLAVPASSRAHRLADFVTQARASDSHYNLATFGPGTPSHFGAEMFARTAGFRMEPVHYRSAADALIGVGGGDVQALFLTSVSALAQARAGKIHVLATTASRRLHYFPDVPTFAEAGYPQIEFSGWFAFFVPAATPAAVQDLVAGEIVAATHDAEVRRSLQEAGFSVLGTPRAEALRMVEGETRRWAGVVKAIGFRAD